jgi:hypothetical protein
MPGRSAGREYRQGRAALASATVVGWRGSTASP